jgi:hypothetical protein
MTGAPFRAWLRRDPYSIPPCLQLKFPERLKVSPICILGHDLLVLHDNGPGFHDPRFLKDLNQILSPSR